MSTKRATMRSINTALQQHPRGATFKLASGCSIVYIPKSTAGGLHRGWLLTTLHAHPWLNADAGLSWSRIPKFSLAANAKLMLQQNQSFGRCFMIRLKCLLVLLASGSTAVRGTPFGTTTMSLTTQAALCHKRQRLPQSGRFSG